MERTQLWLPLSLMNNWKTKLLLNNTNFHEGFAQEDNYKFNMMENDAGIVQDSSDSFQVNQEESESVQDFNQQHQPLEYQQHYLGSHNMIENSPGSQRSKSGERRTRQDRQKSPGSSPMHSPDQMNPLDHVQNYHFQEGRYNESNLDSTDKNIIELTPSKDGMNLESAQKYDSKYKQPEDYQQRDYVENFQDHPESMSFANKNSQEIGLPHQYLTRSGGKNSKADQDPEMPKSPDYVEESKEKHIQYYSFSQGRKNAEKKNSSLEYPSFGRKTDHSKQNTHNSSRFSKGSAVQAENEESVSLDQYYNFIISKSPTLTEREKKNAQDLIDQLQYFQETNSPASLEFVAQFNNF